MLKLPRWTFDESNWILRGRDALADNNHTICARAIKACFFLGKFFSC